MVFSLWGIATNSTNGEIKSLRNIIRSNQSVYSSGDLGFSIFQNILKRKKKKKPKAQLGKKKKNVNSLFRYYKHTLSLSYLSVAF